MSMKIAIRADGGSQIGMGHIIRTLVLARQLAKANDVFFICKRDDPFSNRYEAGIEKIRSEGFRVQLVNERRLVPELANFEADCLITDSYDVDENYFNQTKRFFKKTGYIDDVNICKKINVDFVINHNIYADDLNYGLGQETRLFLGPKYTLLRDEFRNAPPKYVRPKVTDILLTVGGSDPRNATGKLISYLMTLEPRIHVVVGPAFPEKDELRKFTTDGRVKLYDNANMFDLMQQCDIAVTACGSTIYELAACGVPSLGMVLYDNQQRIQTKMDGLGLIVSLGQYDFLEKDELISQVNLLIQDYERRQAMAHSLQDMFRDTHLEEIPQFINTGK